MKSLVFIIKKVKYSGSEKYRVVIVKQQFYLGQWRVDVSSNTLSQGKTKKSIEPKAMDVLLLLCQQKGLVVSDKLKEVLCARLMLSEEDVANICKDASN